MNPFSIIDYVKPEFFCNRDAETKRLISAYQNGRNITLTSIRRLGKTGLIKHLFYNVSQNKDNNYRLLYVDILKTENLQDFIKVFSNKLLKEEKNNANWIKKLSRLISGINAKISIDNITGQPNFEFDYSKPEEAEHSVESIFEYLANQKDKYIIAIDEFQQITTYPEKNIEAILRTNIQHQHKDRYIFSGSSKHILISMFNDYGRPFYQSSEMLNLERIEIDTYADFIYAKFSSGGKQIGHGLIIEYLKYLDIHTFYIQYFFNKLFDYETKTVTKEHAVAVFDNILKENEFVYLNYRNILTLLQFRLLESIAKEGGIENPNAKAFLTKYNFSQSSVNKSLKSLFNKEMIYRENNTFKVYDVFFSKWLQRL